MADLESVSASRQSAKHSADDANAPLVTTPSGDYGSFDGEVKPKGMIPDEYLDRLTLFVNSWGLCAPVIGPLLLIISLNMANEKELTMDCTDHSFTVSLLCASTIQSVKTFPRMGMVLSVLLLTWRMLHERAYYVLLKKNIMIDLDRGLRFGHWCLLLLAVLFVMSCSHLCLKFFQGHVCDHHGVCHHDEYMLNNTLEELVENPQLMLHHRNNAAMAFVMVAIMKFIVPAVVCLSTLAGILSLEANLMPAALMLQSDPRKVYSELGGFLFLPELDLRRILGDGLETGVDGTECSFDDACEEIRRTAQNQGCFVLGEDSTNDLPATPTKTLHQSTAMKGLSELLRIDWWPSHLLLDLNLRDTQSIGFKNIICFHYWSVLLLIMAMMMLNLKVMYQTCQELKQDVEIHARGEYVMAIPAGLLVAEMTIQMTFGWQVLTFAMSMLRSPSKKEECGPSICTEQA